jgi:hypothetical protein
MKIATGGPTADTGDIRWHLEVIRHELRPPPGVLDLAEGQAEAEGDAQLADARQPDPSPCGDAGRLRASHRGPGRGRGNRSGASHAGGMACLWSSSPA